MRPAEKDISMKYGRFGTPGYRPPRTTLLALALTGASLAPGATFGYDAFGGQAPSAAPGGESAVVTEASPEAPAPPPSQAPFFSPVDARRLAEAARAEGRPPPATEYFFFPDAGDVDDQGRQRPLGDRIPVVLVHGYSQYYRSALAFAGGYTWRGFRSALGRARRRQAAEGEAAQAVPPGPRLASTDTMKVYYYHYRPDAEYPVLAAAFADRLAEGLLGQLGARKVIFMAHSAGTLMSRYAAADPRIQPRVAGILTLAGVHRGSVQASLVAARDLTRRPRVTAQHARLLEQARRQEGVHPRVAATDPARRIACSDDRSCRVIASLAFDNFDGSITKADRDDFGIIANDALRTFNEKDPNLSRIYAYHGDVTDLGTEVPTLSRLNPFQEAKPVPTAEESLRRAVAAVNPAWSNADPVVSRASGTFADSRCELGGCRTFRNVEHVAILTDAQVMDRAVHDLRVLAWTAQRDQEGQFLEILQGLWRGTQAALERTDELLGRPSRVLQGTGLFGIGGE
jgi:hypothetical protein